MCMSFWTYFIVQRHVSFAPERAKMWNAIFLVTSFSFAAILSNAQETLESLDVKAFISPNETEPDDTLIRIQGPLVGGFQLN